MKDVLLYPLQNLNEYKEILSYIEESDGAALINGLLPMQKSHIAYSLFKELKKQILFIANSDLEAKKVYEDLDGYMKGKVEYLSSQDIYFYHLDAKDRSEEAKKLKTLFKLAKGEKVIVVTSVEAILRKYIPKKVLLDNVITYKVGDVVDIEKLTDIKIIEYRRGGREINIPSGYDYAMGSFGAGCVGKQIQNQGQYALECYFYINNEKLKIRILDVLKNTDWKSMSKGISDTYRLPQWKIYKYLKEQIPELR